MKIFESLRSFVDYMPRCILCQKPLTIVFTTNRIHQPKLYLKSKIVDEHLVLNNKLYPVSINLDSNVIVEGKQVIDNLKSRWLYVKKTCSTCDFTVNCQRCEIMTQVTPNFPELLIYSEELKYIMPQSKKIFIRHQYLMEDEKTFISLKGKQLRLPNFNIDFSKFNSLRQLNTRINTLITFQ